MKVGGGGQCLHGFKVGGQLPHCPPPPGSCVPGYLFLRAGSPGMTRTKENGFIFTIIIVLFIFILFRTPVLSPA